MLVCPNPRPPPRFTSLPPDPPATPLLPRTDAIPKEQFYFQYAWDTFYSGLCCFLAVVVLSYLVDLCLQLVYGYFNGSSPPKHSEYPAVTSNFPPSSSSSTYSSLSSATTVVQEVDLAKILKMNEPKNLAIGREPAGRGETPSIGGSSSPRGMRPSEEPLSVYGGPFDGMHGTLELACPQDVEFTYLDDEASEVGITFDYVDFVVPLEPDRGCFSLCLPLSAGRHSYRFVAKQEE